MKTIIQSGARASTRTRMFLAGVAVALLATTAMSSAQSTDANLSNLAPSAGTLSPVFASGTISYSAAVLGITSMTVTPTAADALATIKVNGNAVVSGNPSDPISLSHGANVITTVVTAEDAVTTKTYTLTVNLDVATFKGANKSNGDNWNVTTNWDTGAVPTGAVDVVIPATKYVTAASAATPTYTGNLSIGSGATLQIGYTDGNQADYNALGDVASTTITMDAGSFLALSRVSGAHTVPAIQLLGDVTIRTGESTNTPPALTFSKGISGSHMVTMMGKGNSNVSLTTVANTFNAFVADPLSGDSFPLKANFTGALGTGDVTIKAHPNGKITAILEINAVDAMASTGTLTLNGPASATKLKLTAAQTVAKLLVDGVQQPPGTYGKAGSGAQYEVSWFNSTSTALLTVTAAPSAYWDLDGTTAGAGGTAPAGTWDLNTNANWDDTMADGTGAAALWSASAGETAVFAAGTDATGTYTVTVSGPQDMGGLGIEEGDVTLSGDGLQMTSNSLVTVASGSSATVGSVIANDSTHQLAKGGAGTLVLSGPNTYTGVTRLEAGTLRVASLADAGSASPLGNYPTAGAGGLVLVGGTFQYSGGGTSVNRGLTLSGNSTLDLSAAGTALTLGNCDSSDAPGTLTITGGAGSSLALGQLRIVEGAGMTLNPTAVSMTVASVLGYTSYPNSSTLTLGGTTTGNVISGSLSVQNPPGSGFTQTIPVIKSGTAEWTILGVIGGGGSTMTVNAGTLTLSGANTYTGTTTVNGGTAIAGTNSLSNTNGAFGKATADVNLGVANGNNDAGILIGGAFTIGRIIRNATQDTTDSGTRVLTLGGTTADNSVFSGNIFLGTSGRTSKGLKLTAANGGQVTFSGVIQETGGTRVQAELDAAAALDSVTKVGAGTVALTNANTYLGNTVVAEGTLSLGNGTTNTTLNDLADVKVATGAQLNLNYTGTDTIDELTLGGAPASIGEHSSATDPTFLTGTGSLTVTTGPAAGGYANWTAGPFLGTLTDTNPALDFDNGGLDTGIEWVVGGDPTDPSDDAGLAPAVDNTTDPDYFIFTYRRSDAANTDPNTSIAVEYGSNLGGWTTAVHDGSNIIITPDDEGGGTGIDLVEVKIKRSLAVGGTLFARLNVAVATP